MLLRCLLAVVICVCAISDAFAQERDYIENCGKQSSNNQYPWIVAIEYEFIKEQTTRVGCAGALVNVRHAVTKNMCINTPEKEAKAVLLGVLNGEESCSEGGSRVCSKGVTRVRIEKFILHPRYSRIRVGTALTGSFDIALVRFVDPVTFTDTIRPICLPSADVTKLPALDVDLYVTGLDDQSRKTILSTETDLLNDRKCASYRFDRVVPEDLMCAKDVDDLHLCLLTGGLMVNKKGERHELAGLLDIGSSCGLVKRFSNVYLYVDWMKSEIPEWTPCGRRKVDHIELITYGEFSKPGDWPWHAAIYRSGKTGVKYTCGGTLITKTVVLTAAHCTTVSGVPVAPEILTVFLGKHYLEGPNLECQEKEVESVIVHEHFAPRHHLDNDIALLRLKTKATYNDYVQPACMWSEEAANRLSSTFVVGTVVGWGLDESEMLSSQLRRATMPQIPDHLCIKKNPLFYSNVLGNNRKFCAGWANGTSTCNGDSGGGFFVSVSNTANRDSLYSVESWYVRGIVSLSVAARNKARCDPNQFAVFTDVANYTGWIQRHMGEDTPIETD